MKRFVGLALAFLASAPAYAAGDAESLAIGRCSPPDEISVYSRSSSFFPDLQAYASGATRSGVPLPSLMVEGWKPAAGSLEKVVGELGSEAGFAVSGSGFSKVSWPGRAASLTSVVDALAKQANADWSFDGKTITLSKAKPVSLTRQASVLLPSSRDTRLAFLDIVRGHGLDATVSGSSVSLSGKSEDFAKAKTALAGTSQLMVFDVMFLRGRPSAGRYDWQSLGASEAASSNAGGKFVFPGLSSATVVSALKVRGDLAEDGFQTVAAPEGWSLSVPQSQCGTGSSELVIKPRFAGDTLSLGLDGAGISASYPSFQLGSIALVAASQPVNGWIPMVLVRPRLVAFKR